MQVWVRYFSLLFFLVSQLFMTTVFASTILGTGSAALLGGDLTDPSDTLDNTNATNTASAIPALWVSATATTEPGFSPAEGGEMAFDVFDNTVGSGTAKWCCTAAPQNVAVELASQYVLTHFTIASGNDVPNRDPDVWSIEGSNDGVIWTPIFTYNNEGASPFTARLQVIRYDGNGVDFPTPAAYRWYRYSALSTVANGGLHQVNEIELFGDNYTVGGDVTGLDGTGLTLQNNAGVDLLIAADGSFTFTTPLADGSAYAVTVLTQPTNLDQTCSVTNGTGTVSGANITNVTVACVTNTYTVGGIVSGLKGSGLELQNNGGDTLSSLASSSFTFATELLGGAGYLVTVSTQPAGQTCSVTNGGGTIVTADITDVEVGCVDDPVVPPTAPPPTDTTAKAVPTMSAYGLVLTMLGLLFVAARRFRTSAKRK